MKSKITKLSIALLFLFGAMNSHAQVEPHFSQYYAYPMWLNPALAGAFDGDVRVTAIHRRQWSGLMQPFSTYGLSADFVTDKNLNIGANIMNQSAGNAGYNYINGYVSLAYTGVRFGADQMQQLVFGMQGGVISRRFDPSKFQFGDQWTASGGFNSSNPGGESLLENSSMKFDFGAGVSYYDAGVDQKANVFAGFSASHLTKPEDPFTSGGTRSHVPIRYTFHGGLKYALNETVSIVPNVIYMRQGTAQEIMAGAYMQMQASEEMSLLGGINYRVKDAVSPYIGMAYKKVTLGISYDVNASSIHTASKANANSMEISLTYIHSKAKLDPRRFFKCPTL